MQDLEQLLPFCTDRQRQIIESVVSLGSATKAAKKLNLCPTTVRKTIDRVRDKTLRGNKEDKIHTEQTEDGFLIEVKSFDRIQTAHEAMQKAGIDSDIWQPVKVIANSWEVVIKDPTGKPQTCPLWQVKVFCNRRVPVHIERAVDALAKRVEGGRLRWPKVKRRPLSDPSTMVLGLVDHHFGKLCWGPEVGSDYDLNIAEELYSEAFEFALSRWTGHEIAKVIIPVGNDFCHIDTRAGTTEAGTVQDVDGRYEKIASVMERALIRCVERAREVADVDVLWVGGNHDRLTSMWLCRCIHWAFQHSADVLVDTSPCLIKYRQFGNCLLGFAHGDGPKEKALKDMMPIERPDDWALSKSCREWITGHFHQQKTTERISTHEQSGMVFRILPSLGGTDRWHYQNGFSMSQKASQSLLYSHKFGYTDSSTYHIGRFYEGRGTCSK